MTQTASQAVSQWMEEHGGKIYGLGLRLCGSAEEAEDLVQETFLQAFRIPGVRIAVRAGVPSK